jgi:hypothetical protein
MRGSVLNLMTRVGATTKTLREIGFPRQLYRTVSWLLILEG